MKKVFSSLLVAALFAVSLASLTGCSNKSESEICEEVESGVVLVLNRSYYEFKLPNGESLYFTSYDRSDGIQGLATEEDSVEYSVSYGTGFIVSDDGKIATNSHVVTTTDDADDINSAMSDVFNAVKVVVAAQYYDYYEKYEQAENLVSEAYVAYLNDDCSYVDYQYFCNVRDALKSELEDLADSYQELDNISVRDCDIIYHNSISVAFNDTYVTDFGDFEDCVIKKCDEEHDVAIIQLKSKHVPDDRYIFYVPDENPLEEYSFGDKLTKTFGDDKNEKLVMIGFNYGPILALTSEGIKCQHTSGSISQESSAHLMYSIPALHGSSGSPVLNMAGELVAVNYAGLSTTQSFTYGVYVEHLRELLDDLD